MFDGGWVRNTYRIFNGNFLISCWLEDQAGRGGKITLIQILSGYVVHKTG
jgi:hypothetical protein